MDFLIDREFHRQALETPRRMALRSGGASVTFQDLDTRVGLLAEALRRHGIGAGSAVGVHMDRSIHWAVGILGILRVNGVVVPLPPTFPTRRLGDIATAGGLDAIIDHAESPADPGLSETIWRFGDLLASSTRPLKPSGGRSDQPAFILSSSGSTGHPKLIVRSHRSFLHRLSWTWRVHPYGEGEVCCQKAHMTTTHAIYELLEPLLRGTTIIIVPDEEVRDIERFWKVVRDERVSRLLLVPSMLRASLAMSDFQAPALRVVVLMGEYVPTDLAEEALAALRPESHVYSIYGSTEASSALLCDVRKLLDRGEDLPLGEPIDASVHARILSPDLTPTKDGAAGRLFIGGPLLFDGYLGRPDLTDEVVIRHGETGERLYDTRDRVRRRGDGALEFLGRVDHTVKVRGFRVSTREVEDSLLRHPTVASGVVVIVNEGRPDASLLAFVTPEDVDRAALYSWLRRELPDYMVPSAVIGLSALPLTPSGKVDRQSLSTGQATAVPSSAPPTHLHDTARAVWDAWVTTLRHGAFGDSESFFEVGGTSLTAFTLLARLREAFGLHADQLDLQSLYRFPTVRELAELVDDILGGTRIEGTDPSPVAVTLRSGDPQSAPVFFVASAGGTLGAYEKLTKALSTSRELVGLRDPYLWGDRPATEGMDAWVGRYIDAIRERQDGGPYFIVAYSSAGAFGYEIASRLRRAGEEVALLALVDPLALDRADRSRYGWWALQSLWMRPVVRRLVRLSGWARLPLVRMTGLFARSPRPTPTMSGFSPEDVEAIEDATLRNPHHLTLLSTLLELNTGLPLGMADSDFEKGAGSEPFEIFRRRVQAELPEMDEEMLRRMTVQYELQIRTQHRYRLRPYDGRVVLAEPTTSHAGLIAALLGPYARRLDARVLEVGDPDAATAHLSSRFGTLDRHYRSMRDEVFVGELASVLNPILG